MVAGAPGCRGCAGFAFAAVEAAGDLPSVIGDGRVRSERTDSVTVLIWFFPVTSILKLTSPVTGVYMMVPVVSWLPSMS